MADIHSRSFLMHCANYLQHCIYKRPQQRLGNSMLMSRFSYICIYHES